MNKFLKTGLLLQIPNAVIISIVGIAMLLPYLTLQLVIWIILWLALAVVNIASLIYIIVGIFAGDKY